MRQQKREAPQPSQRASWPPATHFVGLRCTTPAVESASSAVHARLLSRDAAFSHVLVSPATAHITLCVLTLPDDDAVQRATMVLQTVRARAPSPSLTGALGAFGDPVRVLFLDLAHDAEREALARLHADVDAAMRGAGFDLPRQAFKPHLTVAKAPSQRHALFRRLQPTCFVHASRIVLQTSKVFGSNAVSPAARQRLRSGLPKPEVLAAELPPPVPVPLTFSAMDLCVMRAPRLADGFYAVAFSVPFLAD